MGVIKLWQALDRGGAVESLEGHQPGHHAHIVEAVENKVSTGTGTAGLLVCPSTRDTHSELPLSPSLLLCCCPPDQVVAVDLSAWIMQAQSQPAMLEHYDSPYARAVKIVFDRVRWCVCMGHAAAAAQAVQAHPVTAVANRPLHVSLCIPQTIHWLRYGCLPVFVIEGRTPEAKLDKLRAR